MFSMATAVIGTLEKFDLHTENWLEYIERIELYFVAKAIETDEKKRGVLLTAVGAKLTAC